jgi:hypothetical protein
MEDINSFGNVIRPGRLSNLYPATVMNLSTMMSWAVRKQP